MADQPLRLGDPRRESQVFAAHGSAERARDEHNIANSRTRAESQMPLLNIAQQRDDDELFVADMRAIAAHDDATELFRGGLHAGIQLLHIRHRSAATQTNTHNGPTWLATHRRNVAEIARHRFPADVARRRVREIMHPFNHGIAGI